MASDPNTDLAIAGAAIALALLDLLAKQDRGNALAVLEKAEHIANDSSSAAASIVRATRSKMSAGG